MTYQNGFCLFILGFGVSLLSCSSTPTYAPVTDITAIEPVPKTGIHRVAHGETLYEIAWRYGLDYRHLAKVNDMRSPYVLYSNQKLNLRAGPIKPNRTAVNVPTRAEPAYASNHWIWPAKGNLVTAYGGIQKGINITGNPGDPIYAAARGKVVYSGDGLRGYGNLIILKHNDLYLSAYAHNKMMLVHEGDIVGQGQKIAEMGQATSGKVMLHFEIRRAGQPINPLPLLH